MRTVPAGALVAAIAVLTPAVAPAQSITEVEPLSFGTFVVRSNHSIQTLTMPVTGAPYSSPSLIILAVGSAGQYRVTGLPGNADIAIDVAISPLFAPPVPNSQFFDVKDLDYPASMISNGRGEVSFRLGATLATTGSGLAYTDAAYQGFIDVTVTLQ